MKNKFAFMFLASLFMLSFASALTVDCEQQQADVSTECGGLDTGTYGEDNNFTDGDWDTGQAVAQNEYQYVNYSVPSGTISASIRTKANIGTYTLNLGVSNAYGTVCAIDDVLSLRYQRSSYSDFQAFCKKADGNWGQLSNWFVGGGGTTTTLYEESVTWTINIPTFFQFEDNKCYEVIDEGQARGDDDYDTLDECRANIFYDFSYLQTYSNDDNYTNDFVNYTGDEFNLAISGIDEVTTYAQIEGDPSVTEVAVFPFWAFSTVASLYQYEYTSLNVWNVDTQSWEEFYDYSRRYTSFGGNTKIGRGLFYEETPYEFTTDRWVCAENDTIPDTDTCYYENSIYATSSTTTVVMPHFIFNESYIDEGVVKFYYNIRASYDTMVDAPNKNEDMGISVLSWGEQDYYRFEDNACSLINILPAYETENDYQTLGECEENIVSEYFRVSGIGCNNISLAIGDVTEDDYETLEECEENYDPYLLTIEENGVELYGIMSSAGAGMGIFMQILSVTLPIFLIGLAFTSIFLVVGYGLSRLFENWGWTTK